MEDEAKNSEEGGEPVRDNIRYKDRAKRQNTPGKGKRYCFVRKGMGNRV